MKLYTDTLTPDPLIPCTIASLLCILLCNSAAIRHSWKDISPTAIDSKLFQNTQTCSWNSMKETHENFIWSIPFWNMYIDGIVLILLNIID